jgi:hypothetical protein
MRSKFQALDQPPGLPLIFFRRHSVRSNRALAPTLHPSAKATTVRLEAHLKENSLIRLQNGLPEHKP